MGLKKFPGGLLDALKIMRGVIGKEEGKLRPLKISHINKAAQGVRVKLLTDEPDEAGK